MASFLAALRFLTILPTPSAAADFKNDTLARAMPFFPAVGWLVGFLSLSVFFLFQLFFPERFAILALLVAPILITGGFHMDGFADFCDGFFGEKDKTEILRIMKDPRLGTWGTLGVTLCLLIKFELLQILPYKIGYFPMALATSRWSQVALSFYLPYAGETEGLGRSVAQKIRRQDFLGATLFLTPFFFWLKGKAVFIFLGVVISLFPLAWYFKKKIGGLTGDLLGATNEFVELLVFFLAAALVRT